MRIPFIALLAAATAITPATAAFAQDRGDRGRAGVERADRGGAALRQAQQRPDQRQARSAPQRQAQQRAPRAVDQRQTRAAPQRQVQQQVQQRQVQQRQVQQQQVQQRQVQQRQVQQQRVQWDRGWRQNQRYDWQRHRTVNRQVYRMPVYVAPYRSHVYSRFSIGLVLGSSLLHQRYWIHDPWMYRLPYAPPGYRWVRYYNDVILVDTWTGRVVDVIYDFFW